LNLRVESRIIRFAFDKQREYGLDDKPILAVAQITNSTDINPQSRDQNDLDYKIIFDEIDDGSSVINGQPLQIHHAVKRTAEGEL
jgi:hypothetical protein